MNRALGLIAIVLLSSAVAPAASAAESNSSTADGSLHFETRGNAVVDYAVGGDTVAEEIRVQSQSQARSDLSLDVSASLRAVTGISGSGLSVASESGLQTTIQAESGATLTAHDNGHGSLVVASDDESQFVEVGVAESASAEAVSDSRVVVTTENGTQTAFLATGDGSVTVNDDGNVTTSVAGDGRLVVRSYSDGREEADRQTEDLITSGTAAASVYVTGEGSDTVTYDGSTAVEVTQQAQGEVAMTVERSQSEGRVIVTNVAEGTFESAEDVQVSVDGETAAQASTMAELRQATNGGDISRYMIRNSASAQASAEVLVGVNHFSERQVTMTESDAEGSGSDNGGDSGGTDSDGSSDGSDGSSDDGNGGTTGGTGPGFGALGAVVALLAAAGLLIHH